MAVVFTKQYIGMYGVTYTGKYMDGNIKGKWNIGDDYEGEFELREVGKL